MNWLVVALVPAAASPSLAARQMAKLEILIITGHTADKAGVPGQPVECKMRCDKQLNCYINDVDDC